MIKIKTPLRWVEDERSGSVTLIADDGAVILSDDSREVMPEWLDEITRAVNAHDAIVLALEMAQADYEASYIALYHSVGNTGQQRIDCQQRLAVINAALTKARS